MTNFFDEITSFFTILSEDRERLLAAPILDMQENKNIFRSDQSVSGFIFSTQEKADDFAKQYQEDAHEKYGILQIAKVLVLFSFLKMNINLYLLIEEVKQVIFYLRCWLKILRMI